MIYCVPEKLPNIGRIIYFLNLISFSLMLMTCNGTHSFVHSFNICLLCILRTDMYMEICKKKW